MDPQHLIQVIQAGKVDQARQMLEADPSLANAETEAGLSVVLLAAYYGQADLAQLLASRRFDLTIFEASAVGDQARVQALLAADPAAANAVAADGFQPLGLAAFFGHLEIARTLVTGGAKINLASHNSQRVMPLHSAAASRSLEIARLLLEHDADPNARQGGEFTPLHAAAQNGHLELIELLLAHGAEINLRDAKGRTALGFANEAGHAAAAEWLRTHEAVE